MKKDQLSSNIVVERKHLHVCVCVRARVLVHRKLITHPIIIIYLLHACTLLCAVIIIVVVVGRPRVAAYMEPDRLLKRYRRRRRAAASAASAAQSHSTSAHSSESSLRHNVSGSGTAHSRTKRAIPHIIYPEILVIVDYDGYRLHGGDNVQVFVSDGRRMYAAICLTDVAYVSSRVRPRFCLSVLARRVVVPVSDCVRAAYR